MRANLSNNQLIENYLKGDKKSLEILVRNYLKPIYSFVYHYVGNAENAEDITQEVFVRAWKNLHKFDKQKRFKTWIFAIAKNACIDFLKKKRTIPFSEFDTEEGGNLLLDTIADSSPLPQEIFERAETHKILSTAMSKLSPKYQMVLSMHYNKQYNFREIAQSLGMSLNTVKSQHRRALTTLKRLLGESLPS